MNKQLRRWLTSLQKDAEPAIDECIENLGVVLPNLNRLKDTEQDPEWHSEGNVHIHTGMVLNELYALLQSEASHLQGERRQALILGALLHDIGKPDCTRRREIAGVERVVSPKHEALGRSYLAYKLMDLSLPYQVVELTLGLVGEHHMPKLLVVKDKEFNDYLSLSRRADCELLYFLEVADMSGRICPDKDKQLEYLEIFNLFCREYQVWGGYAKAYAPWCEKLKLDLVEFDADIQDHIYGKAVRDREIGVISTPEEAIAKSYSYRDAYAQLMLMCGPSGAGKSSWIKNHLPDYHVVSLDDIREEISGDRSCQKFRGQVMQEAKAQLKYHLRSHHHVIWDATSLRSDFRNQVCDLAFAYQALVTMVIFQLPESSFFEANRGRQYAVPDKVLQRQIETMEWPSPDEVHRYVVIGENQEVLQYHGGLIARKSPF